MAAGAGLVHFTILGSLAVPASADTDDECATEGCDDGNNIDNCNCKSGDNTLPPSDNCDCSSGDDGNPPEDVCECGSEEIGGGSDDCGCGHETGSDYCTCKAEYNDFPSDCCVPRGCADAAWGCSAQTRDFHTDPEAAADVCECSDQSGESDNCKCWWDGNPQLGGQGGGDYCDCKATDLGQIDTCACCTDRPTTSGGTQADYCNCPEDHNGSICYDEGGYPALADWCNCDNDEGTIQADICTCDEGDQNTSTESNKTTQADMCCLKELKEKGAGPSEPASGDVCDCPADQNKGSNTNQSGGWDATDYCPANAQEGEDVCDCGPDQGVADV